MRHSLYNVPKEHFASTLANLIEFQQPNLATKMATILMEHPNLHETIKAQFPTPEEQINIYWSLM